MIAAPRGYPGIELSKMKQPQRGCAIFAGGPANSQSFELRNRHDPDGVGIGGVFTQGSREARQPWALLYNASR